MNPYMLLKIHELKHKAALGDEYAVQEIQRRKEKRLAAGKKWKHG